MDPTPEGLPLEIYCFTNTTVWASFEQIQSDIFDHLYAVLPEFGLSAFQNPSGNDFRKLTINAPVEQPQSPWRSNVEHYSVPETVSGQDGRQQDALKERS